MKQTDFTRVKKQITFTRCVNLLAKEVDLPSLDFTLSIKTDGVLWLNHVRLPITIDDDGVLVRIDRDTELRFDDLLSACLTEYDYDPVYINEVQELSLHIIAMHIIGGYGEDLEEFIRPDPPPRFDPQALCDHPRGYDFLLEHGVKHGARYEGTEMLYEFAGEKFTVLADNTVITGWEE